MGSHPYIVNIIGCVTVKPPICLLVEYVPNGDLQVPPTTYYLNIHYYVFFLPNSSLVSASYDLDSTGLYPLVAVG